MSQQSSAALWGPSAKRQHQFHHHSASRSHAYASSPQPLQGSPHRPPAQMDLQFPYCDEVNAKYEKLLKIGEGTFGEVWKARNRQTNSLVALKRVRMGNEKEGFPITAIREINILKALGERDNIIRLIEVCRSKTSAQLRYRAEFFLVFDFCEHDLAGLLCNSNVKFSISCIKCVVQQLLLGLYQLHESKILHRDMKAANILISKDGKVKLADFGLARSYNQTEASRYTNRVVTLWYRPPELLLGERNYTPMIDMWGAGCIMAELWTRRPILQGTSEQHQLTLITQLCGSITESVWPNVSKLDLFHRMEMPKDVRRRVKERLKVFVKDPLALGLLDKLLVLNPEKRLSANDALEHEFFLTQPLPDEQEFRRMLSQHNKSNFEYLVPPRKRPGAPVGVVSSQSKMLTTEQSHVERIF